MRGGIVTELSISTGAGVFDAIVAGPPEGRPVLLLHGFPQTKLAWRRQIAALAEHGYRVVAPDQRGYSPGARPQRPEDYRIGLLVDDVVAITEELGWAAFDLVGHDWGGAVAWWTAHAHPGRVRTLVNSKRDRQRRQQIPTFLPRGFQAGINAENSVKRSENNCCHDGRGACHVNGDKTYE